jgi:hypothetical protein
MARGMRFALLGLCSAISIQSCTCHDEPPLETSAKIESREGFNAALPTRKREPRKDDDVLARMRLTPEIPPTLPPTAPPTPGAVALPDDFPADVPVFKDAEPVAVQNVAHNGHTVLFHVDAEPKEVFSFYKEKMSKAGWNTAQEYTTKAQSFLSFQQGKTITNVTIAKDAKTGKQVIAVMYYDEPELPFPEF